MQTIVIAARKGGCSKTTLTAHLAIEAERSGSGPAIFIDTDPQQSLTSWWNDRVADSPSLMEIPGAQIAGEIKKARNSPGLIFIDTPPLQTEIIGPIIGVADIVIIPVRPSPHDLRGVSVTVDLVRRAKKPFFFVVTQAIQRATLTQQAPLILSQHGPVATSIMYNRIDYAGAMTDGRTVQEVDPKGKAAVEIAELWKYLAQYLSNHVEMVANG